MLIPAYTKQFEKDVKKIKKRRKNLDKLKIIVRTLLEGKQLDLLHHNHKLIGKYQGRRECHIEADWLLIYKVDREQVIFERTGTHSDLFKK